MGNVKTVGERLFVVVCVWGLGILTRGVHLRAGSSGSHCYSYLKGQGKGAGTRPEEESYTESTISQEQSLQERGLANPRCLCRERARACIPNLTLLLPFTLQSPAGSSHWPNPSQAGRPASPGMQSIQASFQGS